MPAPAIVCLCTAILHCQQVGSLHKSAGGWSKDLRGRKRKENSFSGERIQEKEESEIISRRKETEVRSEGLVGKMTLSFCLQFSKLRNSHPLVLSF